MPIIRNLRKDFDEGRMDALRTISYEERGANSPYVTKSEGSSSNEFSKRIDDVSRIAQMLVDTPGIKHLANEAILKQGEITKKLESSEKYQQGTLVGNILRRAGGTLKHVAQVAGSTLAQVPVNGTGTHFLRGFRTDTYLQDGDPASGFAEFFGAGGVEGSQYALRGERVPLQGTLTNSKLPTKNTTANPEELGILHIGIEGDITEINPKTENTYSGDSSYTGFGTVSNILAIQSQDKWSGDGSIPLRSNINKDTIEGSSTTNLGVEGDYDGTVTKNTTKSQIQDFRSTDSENNFTGGILNTYSFNYSDPLINKETRVGLGNPGKITRNRTSYTVQDPDTRDKINYLDVSTKPLNGITENRDLIQLEFQILTPDQTYYLAFRAFLDNFDDSFNASWNSQKYLGRADNFYTYGGFERSINIGFKIAAQSKEEMKPIYKKAATLASVTTPTYGENGRFMRGSLAKVTVGDYIYEQPGIIESVQYTWQKDYPWEISFQNPEGEGGRDQILPHVLDVSLSFKVIHDFLPQTGINPFITNYRPIQQNKDIYIPLAR
jgi:hypothetical protein